MMKGRREIIQRVVNFKTSQHIVGVSFVMLRANEDYLLTKHNLMFNLEGKGDKRN